MRFIKRLALAWKILWDKNPPVMMGIVVRGTIEVGHGAILKNVTVIKPANNMPGISMSGYGSFVTGCIVTQTDGAGFDLSNHRYSPSVQGDR